MSLINRMLRDLSSRQPAAGDVMSGIQLPGAAAPPRGGALGRIAALLVLVVVFTGGLWFAFGPKPVKIPQPRQAPSGAVVVTEPGLPQAAEAPPAPANAQPSESAHLKMDTELSSSGQPDPAPAAPAPPAPAEPVAASPPPKVASKSRPRPAPASPATGSGTTSVTTVSPRAPQAAAVYADARRALERGDQQAAEKLLLDALALDPKMHGAREDLGNLRVRQGRFDEAEANARAGFELDPAYAGYRRLAARIELARGRPAAAVVVLEQNPPAVERDAEYHALLASAYQRIGRHEEASQRYQALARLQPDQASWWAGYGLSRDALGDAAGALTAYARARQLGNLDPRVLEHINQRTLALQPAG